MRVAIIGSRSIRAVNLEHFVPPEATVILSGGAEGVDQLAAAYAKRHNLPLTEFLPDYPHFGRSAPLVRNRQIVEHADLVLAFWDGRSRGTRYTVRYAKAMGVPVRVFYRSVEPNEK